MTEPIVTLLMAVYNAEDYLPQALDSLLAQTLREVQIVCIDDASTDSSVAILERYAEIDSRVEVVRLDKNQGQAHARNVGLRQARGRYIGFVDSDDWLSTDALQSAVDVFESHPATGCVLFQCVIWHSDRHQEVYAMPSFSHLSGYDAFVASLTWQIHGVYLVRADIHQRYPYDESCRAFSDDNTTRLHYLSSDEVRQCAGRYYYRQHPASTSRAVSLRLFDYLDANRSMRATLDSLGLPSELIDRYECHRWHNVVDRYMLYYQHRGQFSAAQRRHALMIIRRAWQSIEICRLPISLRLKPGYIPFCFSWTIFRIEQEIYFSLKHLFGKI